MTWLGELKRGLVKDNPVFALLLGMCPTLGVTSSGLNGLAMGLATLAVLVASNAVIAAVKDWIPSQVRIPSFIVIIATFVTVIQMTMEAYLPALYETLGLFIPLIVVNCIILGRAEAYASKHGVWLSVADGLGIGFGFTWALTLLGTVRELLGNGSLFGWRFVPEGAPTMLLFVLAPGAFLVLGFLSAGLQALRQRFGKEAV